LLAYNELRDQFKLERAHSLDEIDDKWLMQLQNQLLAPLVESDSLQSSDKNTDLARTLADNPKATSYPSSSGQREQANNYDILSPQTLNEALLIAAQKSFLEIVELLLDHGADVNAHDSEGKTTLHYAIEHALEYNYKQWITLLLKHNADINISDVQGNTATHYATIKNNVGLVEELIAQGADITAKNNEGKTAQDIAHDQGFAQLERVLSQSATVSTRSPKAVSPTAIFELIEKGNKSSKAIEQLLKQGVSPDSKGKWGWTLLHLACWKGYYNLVELLLDYKAHVNEKSPELGNTPLITLSYAPINKNDKIEIAQLLLRHGAEPDAQNNDGRTALFEAAAHGQTELAQLLIDHDATINIQDAKGSTPLHEATLNGYTSTVELLLLHGAYIIRNKEGKNAFDIAQERNYQSIVNIIGGKPAYEHPSTNSSVSASSGYRARQ
jgi:ankyrin repeat protein